MGRELDDHSHGRISHFEILERVGRGGMALVYKARDVRLGRLVALKLLAPAMETREEARLRFLLEARAISALDHPNVCTLYEIGETDGGRMFLARAYVDGGTLRDRLAHGPLAPLEAALLAAQVAEGLGAAHARGSSTATSSRATSCSATGWSRSPTSAWPDWRTRSTSPWTGRPSAPGPTCPPSRRTARRSLPPPICGPSASCSSRWSQAGVPSERRASRS